MPFKDPAVRKAYRAAYYVAHKEEKRAYEAAYYYTPAGIKAEIKKEAKRRGTR